MDYAAIAQPAVESRASYEGTLHDIARLAAFESHFKPRLTNEYQFVAAAKALGVGTARKGTGREQDEAGNSSRD
jgi:hypothetical protein